MIISEITDLMTSGKVRIEAYNGYDGSIHTLDTGNGNDIPFDVGQREVTGIGVIDDQIVLEYYYYDDGKGE